MQLLERDFKRIIHMIFSGTEMTLTTPESFLKDGNNVILFPEFQWGLL